MDQTLDALIRLQKIDTEIDGIRRALDAMPERRASLEARVNGAVAALDEARASAAANQATRRDHERDLAAVQSRLAKYRDQLMAVKTNREYTAMQHEIAAAESEVARIEDLLLGVMVQADDLAARVAEATTSLAEAKAAVEAESADLDAEAIRLGESRGDLEQARTALAATIPPQPLALFTQLRSRRTTAVVAIRDGHCSACNVRIRQPIAQAARLGTAIVQCESCQRILYQVPAAPAPAPARASESTPGASST
jgi:predicted  nucleic acid-binding Zn-ribbon protein